MYKTKKEDINFKKNLIEGMASEVCVEELINADTGALTAKLCPRSTISLKCLPAPTTALYDQEWFIADQDNKEEVTEAYFSAEIKSAANGGRYKNFYAECETIKTGIIPEYLCAVPHFIVYVDTISNEAFFYDGKTFVGQVRKNYDKAFLNQWGTAKGLLFPCTSTEWGFITKEPLLDTHKNTARMNKDLIIERLEAGKNKTGSPFYVRNGLPWEMNNAVL